LERELRSLKVLLERLKDYSPKLVLIEEGGRRRVAFLLENFDEASMILQGSINDSSLATSRRAYVYEIVMGERR
jgi:hypothetical protein